MQVSHVLLCSYVAVTLQSTIKEQIIAERLSARHIIRHYDLIQRFYVCMYVTSGM